MANKAIFGRVNNNSQAFHLGFFYIQDSSFLYRIEAELLSY